LPTAVYRDLSIGGDLAKIRERDWLADAQMTYELKVEEMTLVSLSPVDTNWYNNGMKTTAACLELLTLQGRKDKLKEACLKRLWA